MASTRTIIKSIESELCNDSEVTAKKFTFNSISFCIICYYVASLQDDFDNFGTEKGKNKQMNQLNLTVSDQAEPRFKTMVFMAVIDQLIAELDQSYHSYKDTEQTSRLFEQYSIPLCKRSGAANLQRKYAGDLKEDFVDEIGQFR